MPALTAIPARAWCAVALALCLSASIALGQAAPDSGTLECTQLAFAAQAVAPAETLAAPRREIRVEPMVRDDACWLDIDAARAWGAGRPTWIDVRSAAESRGVRLAGALQIPLADVVAKSFLKDAPIVLVGSGFDDVDLARACGELKRSGFSRTRLLRGGVRAWSDAGQPLAVSGPARALDAMLPAEFHRHAASAPWLVVGIDVPAGESLPALLANMRRVDAGASAPRVLAAIDDARGEIARMPAAERPNAIVVVARDEIDAARWREAVRHTQISGVLFLDGGLAGYQRFLREQQNIAASAGKPLVRPCGSG